jgi:hypothetical protein
MTLNLHLHLHPLPAPNTLVCKGKEPVGGKFRRSALITLVDRKSVV